jgi:vitamin B12 transporter
VSAAVTVFARETSNQIDFFSCFGVDAPLCATRPFGFYDNVRETEARGLELAAEARPTERLSLTAAYTALRTENRSRDDSNRGRTLARRPETSLYASADYRWTGGAALGLGVQRVGESFDDAANRTPLEGYTLVDLRGSHPIREGAELFGRVENLLDESYETAAGYGAQGRTAALGVRVRF